MFQDPELQPEARRRPRRRPRPRVQVGLDDVRQRHRPRAQRVLRELPAVGGAEHDQVAREQFGSAHSKA